MRRSVSRISIPKTKTFSKKASEVNPMMKRFGRYMLKITTFTTVLTFVGLLFLNAGWISPKPMGNANCRHHVGDWHAYWLTHGHSGTHYDQAKYIWEDDL